MGPPGYNGTRGPPGESGLPGPPGINGTQGLPGTSPTRGDLTLCSYQEKKGTEVSTGSYASTDVSVNEANVGLNLKRSLTQSLRPGRELTLDLLS